MKYILYVLFLLAYFPTLAQRCAQLSMESIGGDKTETLSDRVIHHSDGSFSLRIGGISTSGNINTSCPVTFPSGGIGNVFYRRYNANGTTFLDEHCVPVATSFYTERYFPQPNGDTIFIGQLNRPGAGIDIAVERRSGTGNVLWTKFYGGSGGEGLADVTALADGSFLILTATNSSDGDVGQHYGSQFSSDNWVFKIDNNGNFLWGKVLGGSGGDSGQLLFAAEDGSFHILGGTGSTDFDATGNHGGADLWVVKLDSTGNKLWHRCLGGSGSDANFIKALSDGSGGFYILSWTESLDGDVRRRLPDGLDFWLVHIDGSANIIWENTFGGPGTQMVFAFCQATDGSLWMGGYTAGAIGGMVDAAYGMTDAWVVHADSLGNFINQRSFGGNKEDQIDMLHPLPDGTVLAGGNYYFFEGQPGPVSPGFPQTSQGERDIFLTRLGPESVSVRDPVFESVSWEVFPNPGSSTLHIRVKKGDKGKCELAITDATGMQRYKGSFRDKLDVNITGWHPGTYWVTVRHPASGSRDTKKITIISH